MLQSDMLLATSIGCHQNVAGLELAHFHPECGLHLTKGLGSQGRGHQAGQQSVLPLPLHWPQCLTQFRQQVQVRARWCGAGFYVPATVCHVALVLGECGIEETTCSSRLYPPPACQSTTVYCPHTLGAEFNPHCTIVYVNQKHIRGPNVET
jgi:hypothetical protein